MAEQAEQLEITLDKVLQILVRRRWWILVPATVFAVCAALASLLLPNRYESEATILVAGQQVPERYVTSNSNTDIREVLLLMTDAILSRTQLLQIIDEFGLYQKERKSLPPERLVELMRSNITIQPEEKGPEPKGLNSFKISFIASDARSAQEVTNRLTTLFIDENNASREQQSTGTTEFLADQLSAAEADLHKQDIRVRDFKMKNLGELPDQNSGNLAILGGLHQQLQNTEAALGRAHEQQVYLESLLRQYRELATAGIAVSGSGIADPAAAIRAELVRLQNQRTDLMSRYTEKYPDVVKTDQQIKKTEALLAAMAAVPEPATSGTGNKAAEPAKSTEKDSAMAQLKSQLEANRIEMENDSAEQKRIQTQIEEYERRLNLTPVREEQLAELLRGYDEAKKHYDDLMAKKTESELATSLIKRQQGERFRIVDQPSFPSQPVSPARLKFSLTGLAIGLAVGLGLAFFVDSRNHSLRDELELRRVFAFPLMLGIPMLLSPAEELKRSHRLKFEWVGGLVMCLLIGAAEFYVYWQR